MSLNRIKVFHLEDYKIMRDGIKFLLSQDRDIDVTGEAKNGEELIQMLPHTDIDVLLLDIYLDGMEDVRSMDGFTICSYVHEHFPEIKVVAHSVYDDADRVARIMNAGAMALYLKRPAMKNYCALLNRYTQVKSIFVPKLPKSLKTSMSFWKES